MEVIPPKPVAIGDRHQADIHQGKMGIEYTGDEKVSHLHLTPAVKPEGYVPGIPEPRNDGFLGTREWGEKQLEILKSKK